MKSINQVKKNQIVPISMEEEEKEIDSLNKTQNELLNNERTISDIEGAQRTISDINRGNSMKITDRIIQDINSNDWESKKLETRKKSSIKGTNLEEELKMHTLGQESKNDKEIEEIEKQFNDINKDRDIGEGDLEDDSASLMDEEESMSHEMHSSAE